MKKSIFGWITAIIFIGALFLVKPKAHECTFIGCPMVGQTEPKGCGICEPGSDCYAIDMIHFDYPEWTYDQCETYLFNTRPR